MLGCIKKAGRQTKQRPAPLKRRIGTHALFPRMVESLKGLEKECDNNKNYENNQENLCDPCRKTGHSTKAQEGGDEGNDGEDNDGL